MENFMQALDALGNYKYILIGMFVLAAIFSIVSMKLNKNALEKWLKEHPTAVKIELSAGSNLITQKELLAEVVRGEAAIFAEKGKYIVCAVPGDIVLRVTYSYTRPGVMYKTATTTWGPSEIDLTIEPGKDYVLSFDKEEQQFNLTAK